MDPFGWDSAYGYPRSKQVKPRIRSARILEAGTEPELKEGFYISEEISKDHPYFIEKKLNSGPNIWLDTLKNQDEFKKTSMNYY